MAILNFFDVASRHAEWAAHRRTVIASNVANANTPNYKSRDVEAFSVEAFANGAELNRSHPSHFHAPASANILTSSNFSGATDEYHSGNNVSLDRELLKASAVSREQSLNSGLMKAFNRLIQLSTRG